MSTAERTRSRRRYVGPLVLPGETYKALCARAERDERDPLEQARWMLDQALATAGDEEIERLARALARLLAAALRGGCSPTEGASR